VTAYGLKESQLEENYRVGHKSLTSSLPPFVSHYPLPISNVRPESNMAAYKMAVVKFTPPIDFPLGLISSHMVVIHLFLMLCDLQRVVRDLCPILYSACPMPCVTAMFAVCHGLQAVTVTTEHCLCCPQDTPLNSVSVPTRQTSPHCPPCSMLNRSLPNRFQFFFLTLNSAELLYAKFRLSAILRSNAAH
jgi:hypothetical protein